MHKTSRVTLIKALVACHIDYVLVSESFGIYFGQKIFPPFDIFSALVRGTLQEHRQTQLPRRRYILDDNTRVRDLFGRAIALLLQTELRLVQPRAACHTDNRGCIDRLGTTTATIATIGDIARPNSDPHD